MIRKGISLCVVVAISVFLVAGCGGEKNVDPYAKVSLRQALYGPPVISKGFKYKIVDPEIVEAAGHLCLVRDGNITSMIAGRSLAEKIEGLDKSHLTFNVVKKYSPYVHFQCEQVVSGQDTVFISSSGSILFPAIKKADEFRAKDYDETGLNHFKWNDSAGLRKARDQKFEVKGMVSQVDEDGENVWMIKGGRDTALRVVNLDDSILMVLRMLTEANMEFDGGITFNEEENWTDRRSNHVSGTVTIDWVTYGDFVFSII
jgi:hypothetical protein